MSDSRLTDDELARLLLIADTHSGGITMMRSNARSVLLELRERRAADSSTVAILGDDIGRTRRVFLSGQEVEALEWAHAWLSLEDIVPSSQTNRAKHATALAALDKLLAARKP